MEKEPSFFDKNLDPFVEELENAAHALSTISETTTEGMCFLFKDTLSRIARDLKDKKDYWERNFEVYRKQADD